jgi:glycosyltransferase involved in cell wall biosynthesis
VTPALSVTTPVYNGEAWVHRSYAMLRLQTFTDWEWVVVDDGSTDGTADAVRALAARDPRIRLVQYGPNRGRGHARTAALEAARGDWMVVWDVDDMYYPDRLATIAGARAAGFEFCCSYALVVTNELEVKGVRSFHPGNLVRKIFVHPTLACRMDLARRIGYDAGPGKHIGEDALIVETLARDHRGLWVDDVLAIYQEDEGERYLRKAIDSNRGQYYHVRNMLPTQRPPLGPVARARVHLKWRTRMLVLNLMRLYPRAYVWTIRRRPYGQQPEGWSLAPDRLAFLERIRAASFTAATAADAEGLAEGLRFAPRGVPVAVEG